MLMPDKREIFILDLLLQGASFALKENVTKYPISSLVSVSSGCCVVSGTSARLSVSSVPQAWRRRIRAMAMSFIVFSLLVKALQALSLVANVNPGETPRRLLANLNCTGECNFLVIGLDTLSNTSGTVLTY